jgi:hypothetical protein
MLLGRAAAALERGQNGRDDSCANAPTFRTPVLATEKHDPGWGAIQLAKTPV